MIHFFRSFFQSKIGLFITFAFLGLIALAFASSDVTGSGAFGGLGSGSEVAEVDGQGIGTGEFTQTVNSAFNSVRQQNPRLDMATFVDQGGFDTVLEQMIEGYALLSFGEKHGFGAGKRLVDSEITGIAAFRDASGNFSEDIFRRALQQQGLSEARIRDDLRRALIADQLTIPASFGVRMSEKLAKPYADLILEGREGQIALVPSSAFAPKGKIADKTLQAFYKDNADRYRVPERRKIVYATFTRDRFRDEAKASAKEIRDLYESRIDQYRASQRRRFVQVIAPTEAAAKALAAEVKGGKTLEAAGRGVGLSLGEVDFQSREELTESASAAVSNAVFAAKEGELVTPAQSPLGWHVIRLVEIRDTPEVTLDEVRPELENEIVREKMRDMTAEFTERLEDSFADGASLEEIAKSEGLKLQTTPMLLASGQSPDDPDYRPVAYFQQILPIAFTMEEDSSPQIIETQQGVEYAVFAIDEIAPSAPPPLAEIRDRVEADYRFAEGSKGARKLADKIAKGTKSTADLEKAIAGAEMRLPNIERIGTTRREMTQSGQRVPPPVALLFSMAEGTTKVLEAPSDRGWFVVHLSKIDRGDASKEPELLAATRQQLSTLVGDEYRSQFVAAVKAGTKIERSETGIRAVKDQLTGRSQDN